MYYSIYKSRNKRSLTVFELIIALVLFSLVLLGLFNISSFSYQDIIIASRRTVAIQTASLIAGHMAKNISQAIGSVASGGIRFSGTSSIAVRWDRPIRNGNGIPDDDANGNWIAYIYTAAQNRVQYYANHNANGWAAGGGEELSVNITQFSVALVPGTNCVALSVTACFRAADGNCGTRTNPTVTMETKIAMPMMSVR